MAKDNFYQLLHVRAAASPDKPFLYLDDRGYSYAQIAESADAIMARLPNVHGSIVLIQSGDFIEQLLLFFAVQGAKGVPVIAHFPTAPTVIQSYGVAESWADSLYLLEQAPPTGACFGVLSSGSTGVPRMNFRTFQSWADFYPVHNKVFSLGADACLLLHGSLSFTGNLNAAMAVLYAGGTIAASKALNPRLWLRLIERCGVTAVYLIPEKLHRLAIAAGSGYNYVRTIFTGSQLLGDSTMAALRSAYPGANVFLYYGTSECSFITCRKINGYEKASRNVGKPFPGISLVEQRNSLWVDTPYAIIGLPRPCELPDQGHVLEDGSLLFLGRKGNTANLAGVQVSLTKIELRAQSVPGVATATALCYQADGKRPRLCLFYTGSIEAAALYKKLGEADFAPEVPWKVIRVETIPLSSAGKPDMEQLRTLIEQRYN